MYPAVVDSHLTSLLVSLGIGLLMGVERERRKGTGSSRNLAGIRTFAIVTLAGALAQMSGIAGLALLGAALVAALAVVAHWRDRSDDPGVTTELALFVAYLLGVTAVPQPVMAAATGVVVTILLAAREHLHRFSTEWLTQSELRDALVLVGLALVLLPLLPDHSLFGVFVNPHALGRLVIILLAVQALGHIAQRLLGLRHGLVVAGIASGFVSSTATIAAMAARSRAQPDELAACVRAAVASNTATMLQLMVVAAAVAPAWLGAIWMPATLAAGCAMLFSLFGGSTPPSAVPVAASERGAFRVRDALVIAALLAAAQFLTQFMQSAFGHNGMLAAAAIAGFADLHAASAALFSQQTPADLHAAAHLLALPLSAVLLANMTSKLGVAFAGGGWRFLARVAPVVLAITAVFCIALWVEAGVLG